MRQLELRLFGLPEFILDGEPIEGLVSSKARALFIFLALSGKPHSRLELATMFWDNQTDSKAKNNLRVALTRLNKVLGEFLLVIGRRELAINPHMEIWIDSAEFDDNTADDQPAIKQLETAVQLYHHHFLDGFHLSNSEPFDEWVWEVKERYRNKIMTVLSHLASHYASAKLYDKAITYLNRLVALEPWSEEAHQQLMRLYTLNGHRSSALAQYEQCCGILQKEFEVTPSEATQALYHQILNEELVSDLAETAVSQPFTPPYQAPTRIPNFVGRVSIAQQIIQAMTKATKPTVHAIVGMGGIGKSALAIEVAHLVNEQFSNGILWANVATGEPTAILERWSQAYGYDFSRISDVDNMSAAFRDMLNDKSVLIVLDDVRSAARIRPLIPNGPHNHLILTTRDHDLARSLHAEVWPLQELSGENGRLLLTKILGEGRVNAEEDAADEICTLLQNLPLAVEITAQRLRSRNRRTLHDMAQRLRDEKQRLSYLEISDQAVRASFTISWESLDQAHRRIFSMLGLFNGRSFTADAIAAIAELALFPTEDLLFNLAALSLVQEIDHNRYRQHALLADFAKEKLAAEDVAVVNGRFAQHYLTFAQQHQTDYDSLRPEWENMMAAMQAAYQTQLWQTTIDFADTLHEAWFKRGRYTQARQGYAWAYAAATILNNHQKMGDISLNWGISCAEQNNYTEASDLLTSSLKSYQQIDDTVGIANIYFNEAQIAIDKAEYDIAEKCLQKCSKLREKHQDQIGIADTMQVQARILYRRSNFEEAYTLAQNAITIYTDHQHPLGEIQMLGILVNCLIELYRRGQDERELAKDYAIQAIQLAQKVHDQGEIAVAQYGLSRINSLLGAHTEAEAEANNSLAILEKIGDRHTKASVLMHLSEVFFHQQKYREALKVAEATTPIIAQLQAKRLEAYNWWNIGHFHRYLNEKDQAQKAWSKSLEVATDIQDSALIERLHKFL